MLKISNNTEKQIVFFDKTQEKLTNHNKIRKW